jgi:uncharacterized protein (DUF2147 family)
MSRRSVVVAVVFLSASLARGAAQGAGAVDEIVGTWSGSSVCSDRQAAPACKDEQVVYEIHANPGKPNTVTTKADKVVDGKRLPMGDLEFTRDAKDGSWTSEIDTPRVHALWRLRVDGATLSGTLTSIPSNAVVRKIDLRKEK